MIHHSLNFEIKEKGTTMNLKVYFVNVMMTLCIKLVHFYIELFLTLVLIVFTCCDIV